MFPFVGGDYDRQGDVVLLQFSGDADFLANCEIGGAGLDFEVGVHFGAVPEGHALRDEEDEYFVGGGGDLCGEFDAGHFDGTLSHNLWDTRRFLTGASESKDLTQRSQRKTENTEKDEVTAETQRAQRKPGATASRSVPKDAGQTGRYIGQGKIKEDVKDARLRRKSRRPPQRQLLRPKSRRPLQSQLLRQKSRRDAGATKSEEHRQDCPPETGRPMVRQAVLDFD